MGKYREFKGLNLPSIDKEILAFWEEEKIFERSVEERPTDNTFVFYEGPPSANGKPGIHHVMARTVKDLFCRFHTMKGERVERKGGWDTHGLPIELNVEKRLGITKEDIGTKITVEQYNQECRTTVMQFKDQWDDITKKMGYWVDLDNPYITFDNNYIESVWWLLQQLYKKDLLYKGYTVQPYSPAAGTGLSSHELNMPGCYKDVKDVSVTAQFKVIRDDKSEFTFEGHPNDVYFIAWTTTPWTLPSNCAVALGAKIDYGIIQTFNPYTKLPVTIIMAIDLMPKYFKAEGADMLLEDFDPSKKVIPYKIIKTVKGAALEGIHYEQLMPYVQPESGDAFRAILGDFVSTEDGTGIVHTASVFGADDYRVCQQNNVPSILVQREKSWYPLVDTQGKFVEEVGEFGGDYVRAEYYSDEERKAADFESTDLRIAVKLKKENRAFKVEKYDHSYPHCWRTDKPILYYPLDSWFIKSSSLRDRMAELNKSINWKPAHTGTGRFQVWLENLLDWNLSRSRFWGIPLSIWRTENGEEEICIGSIEELTKEVEAANQALSLNQKVPHDLHKPYIDEVVLVSPSGLPMKRESDLIDVWFDSGSMPYAQWHYPFENKEKFERNFPANFIAEGVDQTRGWFYTLHAIATMVFDGVAFKNVVSNGLVLDKNGQKMSKRLGNAVDPFETLEAHGADATRWYMMANANPWDNLKFDIEGIQEVKRKFFGTLYNTYSFFALYANIDNFNYSEENIDLKDRTEIDRWIISLLNTLIVDVKNDFEDYEPTRASRKIQDFVESHLSNWYVRLCRRRFWKGEYTQDKIAAYQTLYTCLKTISKLMAPVAPFFADWMFKNLNEASNKENSDSVHLSLFPESDSNAIDKDLEQRMNYAQRISSLVLSLRKKENLRVRQPLQKILLPILDENFEQQVKAVEDLILHEVNVKQIEYIKDASGVIKKKIKPNFKTLGRTLGKDMKAASQLIMAFSQDDIDQIEKTNAYELEVNGTNYSLTREDFEIQAEEIPGWQVAQDGDITVALDINLNDELIAEGTARELVKHIQGIRRDKGFEVTDKINITLEDHEIIQKAVNDYGAYIKTEVLAEVLLTSGGVKGEKIDMLGEVELDIIIDKA
ncbi:MAG: isoleucine--tRNA ligase [Saprospiraceae bacterium]|nr:isoleucine--tRNA ligase [Bacteroidia bacterium]NNE13696.1 isoleucine--tRNA ligase [Saprospiraceae bacterium]